MERDERKDVPTKESVVSELKIQKHNQKAVKVVHQLSVLLLQYLNTTGLEIHNSGTAPTLITARCKNYFI